MRRSPEGGPEITKSLFTSYVIRVHYLYHLHSSLSNVTKAGLRYSITLRPLRPQSPISIHLRCGLAVGVRDTTSLGHINLLYEDEYKTRFARNSTRSSRKNIKPRNRPVFRTKVMASPGELKSVTLSGTAASNCSIVTCTLLNPTAQGDEINQRIGRETRMKHINIRGFL